MERHGRKEKNSPYKRILPAGIRGIVQKDIYKAIAELGNFFKELCSKTFKIDVLLRLKAEIPVILCKLEKIYPPAFFDVMVHLAVHLPDEAILRGPVQYGWMFPIERRLGKLKHIFREELEKNSVNDIDTDLRENFQNGSGIMRLRVYSACNVNGVRYHTIDRGKNRKTQNNGIKTHFTVMMKMVWTFKLKWSKIFETKRAKILLMSFIVTAKKNVKMIPWTIHMTMELMVHLMHQLALKKVNKLWDMEGTKCTSLSLMGKFDMNANDEVARATCTNILKDSIRQQRYRLKSKYFNNVPISEVLSKGPPPRVSPEDWAKLVEKWTDPKHKMVNNNDEEPDSIDFFR
uniref:DUF4218 domain-containing protein n=1 Tax=Oryza brachyantha TaxID=4533 RepID=J3MK25_ORYBR